MLHGRLVEAGGGLVEDQQLRLRIERVRQQHASQLAAGEHGERPPLETRQADALEQPRDRDAGLRAVSPRQTGRRCRVSARKSATVTGSVGSTAKLCGT